MTTEARRRLVAGLLIVLVVGAAGVVWRRPLWRAVYPVLPPRLQALPYRLPGLLPGQRATPVAVPTAGGGRAESGESGMGPTVSTIPSSQARTAGPSPFAEDLPTRTPSPPVAPPTRPTRTPAATPSRPAPVPSTRPAPATLLPTPPARASLTGLRHAYQTWNNCGPATIAMALGRWGSTVDQATAARALKPDPNDKNVGPEELAAFARDQGFDAVVRADGDPDRLRDLLGAGVPVIIETWFVPEPGDEMGHYRLLVGYDRDAGVFHAMDSYLGPELTVTEADMDRLWRVFNRTYIPVFARDRRAEVETLLGPDADDRAMFEAAAGRALDEIGAAEDAFGWFNLGSSLVALGDMPGASEAFDRARALGLPWRMLWYQFGPFEAYASVDRWRDVEALATANLANADNLEESHYWLGRAREATGDVAGAREAWTRAVDLNPLYLPAERALEATRP